MDELFDDLGLKPRERRQIEDLAAAADVSATALLPEIIIAYLRLLKDAPAALPRNPMRGLAIGAARRSEAR